MSTGPAPQDPPSTREAVARLLANGFSRARIARELGVTKATVTYHAHRLGQPGNPRCARRYDWSEVQRYYDAGHSVSECQAHFGFARAAWADAVRRGAVTPRPQATPLEQLLGTSLRRGRWNIKRRLLAAGLKENRCEECGISTWQGKPLSLALHHCNGLRDDNRLENLALLCPNCHSQTENFGILNRGRREAA
jgi:transposase-like protein